MFGWKKKPKEIERVCGNCKLYDPEDGVCSIVVIFEGKKTKIPVLSNEPCFFETPCFDPKTGETTDFIENVEQVRFWVETEDGKPTDGNGIVKVECSEQFFVDSLDDPKDH